MITSLEGGEPAAPVVIVASTRVPQESGLPQRFKLELPRLDMPDFAGPGAHPPPPPTPPLYTHPPNSPVTLTISPTPSAGPFDSAKGN